MVGLLLFFLFRVWVSPKSRDEKVTESTRIARFDIRNLRLMASRFGCGFAEPVGQTKAGVGLRGLRVMQMPLSSPGCRQHWVGKIAQRLAVMQADWPESGSLIGPVANDLFAGCNQQDANTRPHYRLKFL